MYPPKFGYVFPDNLNEALEFLEKHDDSKALAGGHSLIPMLKLRIIRPSYLVDIRKLNELHYLKKEGDEYAIGALSTHYEISKANIPLLSETASKIGDPQVRNMGTIGGSASHLDPSADYPAALIAMDAKVKIVGKNGERTEDFSAYDKDMFSPDLNQGELLKEIRVNDFSSYKFSYQKLEKRAGDFAIVGVAVLLKMEGEEAKDVRIGLTAVNNKAVRAYDAENILKDKINEKTIEEASNLVLKYANPSSDIRGSAEYKKKVTKIMTKRAIIEAIRR